MAADECCPIEKCDIFDFMAKYVGLSVLHPGGFSATDELTRLCQITRESEVIDIACGKGTTAIRLAKRIGCRVVGVDISDDRVTLGVGAFFHHIQNGSRRPLPE